MEQDDYEEYQQSYAWEDVPDLGSFTTIWHGNKIYGEVDPVFNYKFERDLCCDWAIMSKHIVHKVKFNHNRVFPLIKEGWTEMKDIFGFTDLQKITLSYGGNYNGVYGGESNFRLIASEPIDKFDDVPFYHSQSLIPGITKKFDVQLSNENINQTSLTLTGDFEEYLRQLNLKFIILCCDNGSSTHFNVNYTDEPEKTTTIGNKWDQFCKENRFEAGDLISFKFSIVTALNVVHVFFN